MSFFQYYFSDTVFERKEVAVCCPFPHATASGIEYLETNPSAHINTTNNIFHCKSCGRGLSEVSFISQLFGCSYDVAVRVSQAFKHDTEDRETWNKYKTDPPEYIEQFKIAPSVVQDLALSSNTGEDIAFPVFMFDKLLDVRQYTPNKQPKIKSRLGAISGLIIPFDEWYNSSDKTWTIICAGEKDMAVARSHKLNAITLTGGEQAVPIFKNAFKNKKVAICYDYDDAGIQGAKKLAQVLLPVANEVRVITSFHDILQNKGEDITDFFNTYNQTKADLVKCIKDTASFTTEDADKVLEGVYPTVTLLRASEPQFINRMLRANVQVVATFESSFVAPSNIEATKTALGPQENKNSLLLNETKNWTLNENNLQDLLHLVDNNFTESTIKDNIRKLLGISSKESYIKVAKLSKVTLFKCVVTDMFESNAGHSVPMEYTAYTLNQKLESGKKYKITFKLVPHPYKGQQLVMLITHTEQASDSVTNFIINDTVRNNLKVVRDIKGSVVEKVNHLTERVKGLLGYDGNNQLIQAIDLSYHTVLHFNLGRFKDVRGYLDTFVVGESRVGKSSTALALQRLYDLGTFTSLAGNSATVAGLIGGSNKVSGSYQTRAGLIPQNHMGLIIFEEFAKCNSNIIKELTDIRSSNEVRITRVSGTLNLPAMVRMITLTNVKTTGSVIKPITSYPNGIEVITELIGTAEDIARYDLMLVLDYKADNQTDPFWEPLEPLPTEVYRTKIRWVWSRKAEQIVIDEEVGRYIIEESNRLNSIYKSHIKIFGTETWKKITRLAIAVAGYIVSTDDEYENIIVTKECVDFAVEYFVNLYDNKTFKFKEYVYMEQQYSTIDADGIGLLQKLFITNPSLLLQLERNSSSTRNALTAATGLSSDEFNKIVNQLVKGLFIRFQGHDIIPTERFRLGMVEINRNISVPKVGERNAYN